MNINWEPLRTIIDDHQRFVLSSHVRPDADALGSELALAEMLEALGKSVRIINPSAAPDSLNFLVSKGRIEKIGNGVSADDVRDTDVHIILDTSAWGQLSDVGKAMRHSSAVKVVIDHHVSSDDLGAIEFKETTAEATGALIFQMAEALSLPMTASIAESLFCAIATDTGWFRFPSTTSGTMRTIGRLMDLGAEPHRIYRSLYEQYSLSRIRLSGCVLSRVEVAYEGRLAYTWVEWNDFVQTGAKPVDTEELVNECLRISGTHAAFIAVEQQNRQVKVSLRSRTDLNVAQVAEQFGGGGHMKASGALLPGPISQAVSTVRAAMRAALDAEQSSSISSAGCEAQ
jgi:bifunctional oligoribonuclease and PAP phosphatase NrnA